MLFKLSCVICIFKFQLMLKDIDEALDYLYSFIDYETQVEHLYNRMNYNVSRTLKLLDFMKNPHKELKIFHVAGTKGKGTVCYLLENFLRKKGFRTGLFISPHIEKINERISVCGQDITDGEIIDLMNIVKPIIDGMIGSDKPTTFEILTVIAMYYFKEKGAEYVVLETGMGGRLDSTNFSTPLVSVITSISYDHMDKLGDTIEKIAWEKAGIIKPNVPIVLSFQEYCCVVEICRRIARKNKSDFYYVPDYMSYRIIEQNERGTSFDLWKNNEVIENVFLALPGKHQINNGLTSIMALEVGGIKTQLEDIREVFSSISLPVRVELVEMGGLKIILDSAHNESSARCLIDTIRQHFSYRRLISVVGIVEGKDSFGVISNIAPVSDTLIITNPVSHKPTDPEKVWKKSLMFRKDSLLLPDLKQALLAACQVAEKNDIIIVTGSFYTVSPAMEIIRKDMSVLSFKKGDFQ